MTPEKAIQLIKSKFDGINSSRQVPLMQNEQFFTAILWEQGIEVDNLSTQKLLSWPVFEETVRLLVSHAQGDPAKAVRKGDAMNGKLGDKRLPLDSIEGHIAMTIFDKEEGDSVFRRISPVAAILDWVGVCENRRGHLSLS